MLATILNGVRSAGMLSKLTSTVGIVLICGATAGCLDQSGKNVFNNRWGPSPAVQPAAFVSVAQNQALVLNYLGKSSGLLSEDGRPLRADAWTEIAQLGFNVGRQDCEIYMDTLFRLNREKGRNDSILAAAATAAAAIVTGTTTAQKPLSILAAVFGLSIAVNDAIYESYLFTQAPGLISKKVSDLQEVFRNSVVTGQVQINSPSAAYYAIQSYYRICLPHSIEGLLLQAIADSTPVPPPAPPPPVVVLPRAVVAPVRAVVGSPAMRTPELGR
jgi:hypothetical protein